MQELIITAIIIGFGYFIYTNFLSDEDNEVKRRLTKIKDDKELAKKRSSSGAIKGDDAIYHDDSAGFLIKTLRHFSNEIAQRSKDMVMQKQLLAEAGLPSDEDAILKHISRKIIFASVLGVLSFLMFISPGKASIIIRMLLLIIAPVVGFRFPDMVLKNQAKKRADAVTYALPDAIDLLTVCVEAGLGLDSAIGRVAREQEKSSPILTNEFNRVSKDVLAGISRADAFRNLLKRNSSAELRSFISLLIQSDKLGTSIAQALKVYSDALRTKRRQRAEQLAAQAGVKMSIPLVLFILPATFIIILGPAAIKVIGSFVGSGIP